MSPKLSDCVFWLKLKRRGYGMHIPYIDVKWLPKTFFNRVVTLFAPSTYYFWHLLIRRNWMVNVCKCSQRRLREWWLARVEVEVIWERIRRRRNVRTSYFYIDNKIVRIPNTKRSGCCGVGMGNQHNTPTLHTSLWLIRHAMQSSPFHNNLYRSSYA